MKKFLNIKIIIFLFYAETYMIAKALPIKILNIIFKYINIFLFYIHVYVQWVWWVGMCGMCLFARQGRNDFWYLGAEVAGGCSHSIGALNTESRLQQQMCFLNTILVRLSWQVLRNVSRAWKTMLLVILM